MGERHEGNDNYGKPKQGFLDRIHAMDDEKLERQTGKSIWLSAYANNNPRSDFHWQCDACYDEWQTRDDTEGYVRAYDEQMKAAGYA